MQDIVWPPDGQGPKLSLNGKTGPRTVRSMRYYRYVREWMEQHPKRSIPSAILFPSKKTGGILNVGSLRTIYTEELRPFFTKLLDEPIGQEDRNRIRILLEKSWTPKVFRHTTATEYSPILSAPDANQWFGWTENSNTSSFYHHYNGDEASKSLMSAFGIVPRQQALPKMRECPNVTCKELNTPDAPFCVKCSVPLTVAGHIEQGHQKEKEMQALRNEILETKAAQQKKDSEMQVLKEQIEEIRYLYQDLIQRNTFAYNLTKDRRWEPAPNLLLPENRGNEESS